MNRIKGLRESLGLTQKEMAQAVGLTQGVFSQYEKRGIASLDTVSKIAKQYAVNPAWLAGWSDDDRPEKGGPCLSESGVC